MESEHTVKPLDHEEVVTGLPLNAHLECKRHTLVDLCSSVRPANICSLLLDTLYTVRTYIYLVDKFFPVANDVDLLGS